MHQMPFREHKKHDFLGLLLACIYRLRVQFRFGSDAAEGCLLITLPNDTAQHDVLYECLNVFCEMVNTNLVLTVKFN